MRKPIRLLAALILAGSATGTLARTPSRMPNEAPQALATAMPVPLPSTTQIFRHVTARGTTKPDGLALDARGGTKPSLDAESRRLNRLIRTAVCTGC